ncbi:RluA family pseudouridine synthase [Campylobacter corcagiensis]|uniref:RNA pseudouridylate synthase n=1 Tax=Campylobacter corcagiensis TaxID=1448857 RepID=A0A7M1LGH1_9BACT|nr:RluA family pseudouridine synthase [Campylobacter corcagiensis]QKF64403.1 23S rRNA and tRNA pseudouridine synthase [Campylobacter corcagiensis]QOQ87411.1 RluA family pseudouridine synthase [Campylobacter corcagiensis]
MKKEKAYKLLAIQEKISNNAAKELIDSGLVYAHGKKLSIARGEIDANTIFKVLKIPKPKIIFEDDKILAINKPPFLVSDKVAEIYKATLLNRLDRETSGVLLMSKDEEFRTKAIQEFINLKVKKIYFAMVKGVVSEELVIDSPILTIKSKGLAFSKISPNGKSAITRVYPFMVSGKKSIVRVEIDTGRTHQIRVHLASQNLPIIGDEKYAKNSAKRMYLHSYKTEILGYKFIAPLDDSFSEFGFEIPKNLVF